MNSSGLIESFNPANGELVGTVPAASHDDVRDAVKVARSAFRGDATLAFDRHRILMRATQLLEARAEEFARLVCRETAKPIRDCRVEVARAGSTLRFSAEESLRIDGILQPCDVTSQRLERWAHVRRVPVGIVVAITPFNFPLNIPAHKVAPALAAGNAVIIKPSPKSPVATARFIELLHEAGVPRPMLQILHGGADVVESLARSNVDAVSFTGSSFVGPQVASWSAGKKTVMELGGNGAVVVMDDANVEAAASTIVSHAFGSAGQRCTACKRAVIHRSVYDEAKKLILEKTSRLVLGDPIDERTDVGPLIDEEATERVMKKIDFARDQGVRVLCGGALSGKIVQPTIFEGVAREDRLWLEETFGPVLPMVAFDRFEEAIELVNSTPFGLQTGLFTNRMDVIRRAAKELEVGTVIVNDGCGLRVEPIPFNGVKASGTGQEGIRWAIGEFTHLKTLVM
ncbi:MAG: aldehyde dehydrogenase [Deltaproteobacteria bacterium]|nr:aldehyde dehydrogenase [Deltaproteobacteria bacterium]